MPGGFHSGECRLIAVICASLCDTDSERPCDRQSASFLHQTARAHYFKTLYRIPGVDMEVEDACEYEYTQPPVNRLLI